MINATTGAPAGMVTPRLTVAAPAGQDGMFAGGAPAPPQIANLRGRPAALAGYVVQQPGHGTTPSSLAVEVDAVSASAQLLWNFLVPLPGQPSDLAGNPDVAFTGSSGSDVVATVGDSESGFRTFAFDTIQKRLLWQSTSFLAQAVVGRSAIGTFDTSAPWELGTHTAPDALHAAAVSLQTGQPEWQRAAAVAAANIQQAGPDEALVEAEDYATGNDIISLIHVGTGDSQVITRQPEGPVSEPLPWTCEFDQQATVVCSDSIDKSNSFAFALDGRTGRLLWQLPDKDANRIAPTVTAAYDGELYGTTESGPVVLNARTGVDVNDSPQIGPVAVDADIGIADSADNGLAAYPATRWLP